MGKIIEDFVDKGRKNELNKVFKKRIDGVFNSEVLNNKVMVVMYNGVNKEEV